MWPARGQGMAIYGQREPCRASRPHDAIGMIQEFSLAALQTTPQTGLEQLPERGPFGLASEASAKEVALTIA